WNLRGAGAVGKGSIGLGAALLAPFALMILFSFSRTHSTATAASPQHLDWFGGILIAMWNSMGWDNASTVAREVQNPQRTYPRVMLVTLISIMVVYIVPILAARHAGISPEGWDTGSWVTTAGAIGGTWLGTLALIGAMIGSIGILNSLTMSYSRIPLALA